MLLYVGGREANPTVSLVGCGDINRITVSLLSACVCAHPGILSLSAPTFCHGCFWHSCKSMCVLFSSFLHVWSPPSQTGINQDSTFIESGAACKPLPQKEASLKPDVEETLASGPSVVLNPYSEYTQIVSSIYTLFFFFSENNYTPEMK